MRPTDLADQQFELAMTWVQQGQYGPAADHFRVAVELDPEFIDAHNNLGSALVELGFHSDAVASFRRAIELDRLFTQAYVNLGQALSRLGLHAKGEAALAEAARLDPNRADATYHLGVAQLRLGKLDQALASFGRTTKLAPSNAEAWNAIGAVLIQMGRGHDAIPPLDEALRLDPRHALARAQRMYQLARTCDWDRLASDRPFVAQLGITGAPVPPFTMLAFDDSPERQRIRAERYATDNFAGIVPAAIASPAARPRRLKIGYFSADFHDHATMYLMAGVFEHHDRDRFDVHVYSYGRAADDGMRRRLLASGCRFADISAVDNAEAARLARAQAIDIAIDLKGYTRLNRVGIFAHRAAPLQIGFLGFPGTSGAPFIDYLLVDPVVVPARNHGAYSERLITLPCCYQPNDRNRAIANDTPSRAAEGLPEDGFVFCCFNDSYKITPAEFDVWMGLLKRVEGSVLWLLAATDQARANLRAAAVARGVGADQLVFGRRRPLAEHLARHRLADLFLDTFNCNAHTTASDSLWAGLPVLTLPGESFAARVAASLLHAVGLEELAAANIEDYVTLGHGLATDPARMAAVRAKLAANRETMPLFDSALFTRHLEAGYDHAFARHAAGEAPADLVVSAE